jgi:cytochrome c5
MNSDLCERRRERNTCELARATTRETTLRHARRGTRTSRTTIRDHVRLTHDDADQQHATTREPYAWRERANEGRQHTSKHAADTRNSVPPNAEQATR